MCSSWRCTSTSACRDTPMELGQPTKNQAGIDPGDVPGWGRRDGALSLTVQPGMGHQCRTGSGLPLPAVVAVEVLLAGEVEGTVVPAVVVDDAGEGAVDVPGEGLVLAAAGPPSLPSF